ncbi:hypothetical protein [Roseovarius pacificus]|uniref:Flp family type IVb pilin n=1 Tax=Roseovarius pacificus TaxID=337701 RepID=UPI00259744FB|nr:hypothetical protein [Roseovarius pacificus]
MMKFINQFVKDEDGAVTVDWVVLTAAVVGLGVAGVAAVKGGVDSLAGSIGSQMSDANVVTLGTLGQDVGSGG